MKISCVICEFNPFHNGHEYMLHKMRENGASHVVCIMSGNYTQRGEAAVYDKWTRAKAALAGGADLVIELPVTFACSYAQRFAFGGVYLANALGCADELAFGSESADIEILTEAAVAVTNKKVQTELSVLLKSGITFAAAREKAVEKIYGREISSLLSSPNDILGIEYIKVLQELKSNIRPVTIKREGAGHNSRLASGKIASAGYIRSLMDEESSIVNKYIPSSAVRICSQAESQPPAGGRMKRLEEMLLYRLRTMSVSEIAALPEISEGLENRLYSAVRKSVTAEEIMAYTKSKRYTHSRISRILMYALLDFQKTGLPVQPYYLRVLGLNTRGREILKTAGKTSSLPVVMRYADCTKNENAKKMFEKESYCDDIYSLCGTQRNICGTNMTTRPFIALE